MTSTKLKLKKPEDRDDKAKNRDAENERLTLITSQVADELLELIKSEEDAPMYVPFIMSEDLNLDKIGHLLADPKNLPAQSAKSTMKYIDREDQKELKKWRAILQERKIVAHVSKDLFSLEMIGLFPPEGSGKPSQERQDMSQKTPVVRRG